MSSDVSLAWGSGVVGSWSLHGRRYPDRVRSPVTADRGLRSVVRWQVTTGLAGAWLFDPRFEAVKGPARAGRFAGRAAGWTVAPPRTLRDSWTGRDADALLAIGEVSPGPPRGTGGSRGACRRAAPCCPNAAGLRWAVRAGAVDLLVPGGGRLPAGRPAGGALIVVVIVPGVGTDRRPGSGLPTALDVGPRIPPTRRRRCRRGSATTRPTWCSGSSTSGLPTMVPPLVGEVRFQRRRSREGDRGRPQLRRVVGRRCSPAWTPMPLSTWALRPSA